MRLCPCRYTGMEGVYTHTVKYEKDPACPMCSASVPFEVASTDTLEKVRCILCWQCTPALCFTFRNWLLALAVVALCK